MQSLSKLFSDRSFVIAPLLLLAALGALAVAGLLSSAAVAIPVVTGVVLLGMVIGALVTNGEGVGSTSLFGWQRWTLFVLLVAGLLTGIVTPVASLLSNRKLAEPPGPVAKPQEDKQQQVLDASFSAIAASIPPYGDDLNQQLSSLQSLMKDLPSWFETLDKALGSADEVLVKARNRGNQPKLVTAITKNLDLVRVRWPMPTRKAWTDRVASNTKSIETIRTGPLMTYTKEKIAKLSSDEVLALITTLIPEMNKHDYRGWARAEVQAFETLKKKIEEDVQFLNQETARGKAQLDQPGDLPEPAKWPEPPKGSAPTPPSSDPGSYQGGGENEPEHKRDTLADVARFLGFGRTYRVDVKRGSAQQGDVTSGKAPSSEQVRDKARSFDSDDKFMDWMLAMQLYGATADWPEEQRKQFRDALATEAKERLKKNKWSTSPEIVEIRSAIETGWNKGEREALAKPDSMNLYKGKFLSKGEFSSQEQKDALRLVIFALAQELGNSDVFQIHWINGYGRVAVRP